MLPFGIEHWVICKFYKTFNKNYYFKWRKKSSPFQVDSLVVRKRRVLMSVTQTKEKLKTTKINRNKLIHLIILTKKSNQMKQKENLSFKFTFFNSDFISFVYFPKTLPKKKRNIMYYETHKKQPTFWLHVLIILINFYIIKLTYLFWEFLCFFCSFVSLWTKMMDER